MPIIMTLSTLVLAIMLSLVMSGVIFYCYADTQCNVTQHTGHYAEPCVTFLLLC
jgi:hypothetical protein